MAGPVENDTIRPWSDLRPSGLLWLINTSLLHPRGFAIAVVLNDADEAVGWRLLGDGREPWQFAENTVDGHFADAQATLAPRAEAD